MASMLWSLLVPVVLVILIFYLIYLPPPILFSLLSYLYPDVVWQHKTSRKFVALTIDDGPSKYTKEILSLLQENNCKATFFIIGSNIPGREDILQAGVEQGCELANHGMRDEPARSLPLSKMKEGIEDVQSRLDAIYNDVQLSSDAKAPRYYRPGSGFFSTGMRSLLNNMGYKLVLGDVYPHDAQIHLPWLNAWHILHMIRPGSIIICHDGSGRSWTVPMLKEVLPELQREGYEVVTVSELIAESID